MNSEQMKINQISERAEIAATSLGKAILNSEAYINFINARDKFRTNESAKEAAREYNTVLNDYRMKTRWGGTTQDDRKLIEEARQKAIENTALNDYYSAQENLINFYQELNVYLSEKLHFDFAALAKPAGGCCG